MKYVRLLVLLGVAALLVVAVVTAPYSVVRAQTGSAELCRRVTGPLLAGSGALGCEYPDRGLYMVHYIDDQFVEIALFDQAQLATSAEEPVSVTDVKTGYKVTLSPSPQGDNYRTVDIFDALGVKLSTFEIDLGSSL